MIDERVYKVIREQIKDRDVVEIVTADRAANRITGWFKTILGCVAICTGAFTFFGFKSQWDVTAAAERMKADAHETLTLANEAVAAAKAEASQALKATREDTRHLIDNAKAEVAEVARLNEKARAKLDDFNKSEGELAALRSRLNKLPSTLEIGTISNHLKKSSEWEVDFDFEVRFAFVVPIGRFENIEWIPAIDADRDITIKRYADGSVRSTVRYRVEKKPGTSEVQVRVVAFGFGKEVAGANTRDVQNQ